MAVALARYKDILLSGMEHSVTDEEVSDMDRAILLLPLENTSAESQRAAFGHVKALIEKSTHQQIDASVDLAARETVRRNLDLPLFPRSETRQNQSPEIESAVIDERDSNLLDVEVVAIYW
jgi:hypothetical protein